jgi:hypothetical protein
VIARAAPRSIARGGALDEVAMSWNRRRVPTQIRATLERRALHR